MIKKIVQLSNCKYLSNELCLLATNFAKTQNNNYGIGVLLLSKDT